MNTANLRLPSVHGMTQITSFLSHRRTTLLALGTLVTSAISPCVAQADNTTPWGTTWIENNKFLVINHAYDLPTGATMSHYATNKDNWGGSWNFNGKTGGIGVAQLIFGDWPWADPTSNSGLPIQINSPTDVYSNWNFTKGTISSGSNVWNAYYEIWIHSSSNITTSTLTGDLMIHPDWDSTAVGPENTSYGTYEGEVTLSGTQWYVHRQAAYNGRTYDIIHYMRKNKTQSTGTLRLDDFWEHYATKNWLVSPNHWVGSINPAFEAFSGSGSYRTTQFNVNIVSPLLSNSSFDVEAYDTQTPSGWSEWNHADASYSETYGGARSGARHGTHYRGSAYEVSTLQTKTGLTNGLYTMRAWVKGSGTLVSGEFAGMYAKNYGGSQRWITIPRTSTWTQVEIKDINVTNGSAEIGFYSKVAGGKWIHFDDVEFFKQ